MHVYVLPVNKEKKKKEREVKNEEWKSVNVVLFADLMFFGFIKFRKIASRKTFSLMKWFLKLITTFTCNHFDRDATSLWHTSSLAAAVGAGPARSSASCG